MSRVTAVVVDNLPQSCVAAVSRLVLVGRGGIRLHEEVFLTGIRLRGRAMAEAKVERLLEDALDHTDLRLANQRVRTALTKAWNAPDSQAAQPAAGCDDPPGRGAPASGHRSPPRPPRSGRYKGPGDLRRVPPQPDRIAGPDPRGRGRAGDDAVRRRPTCSAPPRHPGHGGTARQPRPPRNAARSPVSRSVTPTSDHT